MNYQRKVGLNLNKEELQQKYKDEKVLVVPNDKLAEYLKNFEQDNVANNLKNAQNLLNRTPFSDDCSIMVGAILRHTIELIIDEKIFNNQIPVKFHGRKNAI